MVLVPGTLPDWFIDELAMDRAAVSTWDDKPNDYEHALVMLAEQRNATIEECARVAESCAVVTDYGREKIAAAIRALKDKP